MLSGSIKQGMAIGAGGRWNGKSRLGFLGGGASSDWANHYCLSLGGRCQN